MRCRPGVFFSSQKHFAVFGQLMGQPEKLDPKRRKSGSASSTRLVGSSSKKTFKVDSSHWSSTSADATTTRLNGERSMRLDVPSDKSSRGVGSNLEVGSKLLLLLPTLLLLLGRTSSGRNPIPGGLEKIPSSEQGNKKHTHKKRGKLLFCNGAHRSTRTAHWPKTFDAHDAHYFCILSRRSKGHGRLRQADN